MERTKCYTALGAVELDILKLREDARSSGDDTADPDKTVQVGLAKLTKCVVHGEIKDADMNLRVNTLVVRIVQKNDIHGNFVEELDHFSRRVGQKVSEDGLAFGEMLI